MTKAIDTKTALLDCAEELIQRRGVNAMSYNDISKGVGITKASIHHHFPKKEDMVIALLKKYEISYGDAYVQVLKSNKSAVKKLEGIADIFEAGLKEGKICLVGMLSTEEASLSDTIQKILKNALEQTTVLFEKILIQGVDEGTINDKINTKQVAYGILSFLIGLQITSRCTRNINAFHKATREYIKALKK